MDGKTVPVDIFRHEKIRDMKIKIRDMKIKIRDKLGNNPDEQKLIFQGAILLDDKTVDEFGLSDNSVINVIARLR